MFVRMAEQQFPKQRTPQSSTYSSYVDTSGELGSKELGYGMWWVSHKADIFRIVVFLLAICSAVLWAFSLWKGSVYGWYLFSKEPKLVAEIKKVPNFTQLYPRFSPTPLQVVDTTVVPGGVDKYDLVAEVANTNQWFIADFDYYFQVGSTTTSLNHATLIPGEERPVAYLGFDGSASDSATALIITNVRWKRISNKIVPSPAVYQSNRLQFQVTDFAFIRAEANPGVTAHTIKFNLTNNSPFPYKNPLFYVGLYVSDALVGIAPLELSDFKSLETRAIDVRSFVQNLNVTDIKVFPRINVYDPNVYVKPGE